MVSAISWKELTDSILDHGRVCGRHFITGKAAKLWDRYNSNWIPTQNIGHDKCDSVEKLPADLEAAAKRDERARDREMKRVVAENEKRLREEIAAKRQKISEPQFWVSDGSGNWDGDSYANRSLTIYFTPWLPNHYWMRLTSQMTMRRWDFTLGCLLMTSCKQFYSTFRLSTSKTLYISLSVICVMHIMSALQADTYINVWRSTNDW